MPQIAYFFCSIWVVETNQLERRLPLPPPRGDKLFRWPIRSCLSYDRKIIGKSSENHRKIIEVYRQIIEDHKYDHRNSWKNHRKIIRQILRHCLVIFWLLLWNIHGKDISKLDVALFCFLGHRSNPNLMVEVPQIFIFMIFGFLEPLGTLIFGFDYTKLP